MLLRALLLVFFLESASPAFLTPAPPARTCSSWRISASTTTTRLRAFENFFTGGAFDDNQADLEAARIASRIKSVKDLGWTEPEKRRGNARPRHRAFGGSDEKPVQDKPNYDESNPLCVEKWLSQDDFNSRLKASGPAADTVFVALAGGNAFAERVVADKTIDEWRPSGSFDESAFLKTVQRGRTQLALGWGIFGFAVGFAALGIVAPTNPGAKALEGIIGATQASIPPLSK